MTNRNVFWNSDNSGFEFTDKSGTDIDFTVIEDFVCIKIDEHSRDWDNPGCTSIWVPRDKWEEFVEAVNKLKVK